MQHIGKKIKALIDESKLSAADVALIMRTSSQNLYRLFSRESVETKYLFQIAEIIDVPVTAFFEDQIEKGNLGQLLNQKDNEINDLKEEILKLQEKVDDKKRIIEYLDGEVGELRELRAKYQDIYMEYYNKVFNSEEWKERLKKVDDNDPEMQNKALQAWNEFRVIVNDLFLKDVRIIEIRNRYFKVETLYKSLGLTPLNI